MKKKGFTLVELLAVIAILAILVILALPNVIGLYNSARQETFLTEVKSLANSAEKQYMSNQVKGDENRTFSSNGNKLDMTGENLNYCVILDDEGKIEKLAVGNNSYYIMLSDVDDIGLITKSDLNEGTLDNIKCNASAFKVNLGCKYDGKLKNGAKYVNGQYTYTYDDSVNGWEIQLTDKTSTDPVTSSICATINNKPIVSSRYMFQNSKATSIDVSNFDTSNVTDMFQMFYESKATEIKGLENFDTSKVTNMCNMFYLSQATAIDVSSFDTSNVTSMYRMFYNSKATTIDVSNFDTSKVTDMGGMFQDSQATTIKGLENFDTSNVTDMGGMFYFSQATALDLSSFDTSNVTDMYAMFSYSKATTIKGLENFDTSKVTNMRDMFSGSQATTLDVSNFDTSNVKYMNYMFYFSQATALDVSNFNTSKVTDMSEMFRYSQATTGYARTQENADKFNSSSNKPSGLTFVVKD